MDVTLIITTFNRSDALELVLMSVLSQTIFPYEIIIADDGSSDDTELVIKQFQLKYKNIIHSWHEDKGFRAAKSRNKAISLSTTDYIIIVDGDMILHNRFIEDHINLSERGFFIQGSRVLLTKEKTDHVLLNKQINFGILEQGLKNKKNNLLLPFAFVNLISIKNQSLKGIKTCNMSFFKEDIININGFNEEFIGWGREDSELAVRFYNYGLRRKTVKFCAIQYHLWHQENSRNNLDANDNLLNKALLSRKSSCALGINQYL